MPFLKKSKSPFSLAPHPARLDVHGEPVEAFPELNEVRCNGARIAYCGAPGTRKFALCFVRFYPSEFVQQVIDWLATQDIVPTKSSRPPSPEAMQRLADSENVEEESKHDDEEANHEIDFA